MNRLGLFLFVAIALSFVNAANAQIVDTGDKVGIGNSPADAKLHVKGDYNLRLDPISGASPYYYITSNSSDNIIGTNIRTKVGVWDVPEKTKSSAFINFPTYGVGNALEGSILFLTRPAGLQSNTGVARMTISNNGMVGIGATPPATTLHVSTAQTLGTTINSSIALSRFENNGNTNAFKINDFLVREAVGNDWTSVSYMRGVSVDASFGEPSTLRTWIKQYPFGNRIDFGSAGTTYMSIATGHVGIGKEASPVETLDVNGSIRATGINAAGQLRSKSNVVEDGEQHTELTSDLMGRSHEIIFGATRNKSTDWLDNSMVYTQAAGSYSSGAGAIRYVGNGGQMDFFISNQSTGVGQKVEWGVAKMTILRNGNIGIGTFTPSYKLDVAGTIRATEIKVEAATTSQLDVDGTIHAANIKVAANGQTADFVFEEAYDLKDLAEVETYIKEHKHLPNIPSATDMEANGVDVAEMNKLLLQKVEELTLYIIDLEAKNKNEKAERESIETRLAHIESLLLQSKGK